MNPRDAEFRVETPPATFIDWASVLSDLRASGVSGYRVAEVLGVSRSTVQRWENAHTDRAKSDISYGYGRSILMLHLQVCGESNTLQRIAEAKAQE